MGSDSSHMMLSFPHLFFVRRQAQPVPRSGILYFPYLWRGRCDMSALLPPLGSWTSLSGVRLDGTRVVRIVYLDESGLGKLRHEDIRVSPKGLSK